MVLYNLALSNTAPNIRNCAWLKPVEGGFTMYLLDAGKWKPIKLVNDNNTPIIGYDKAKQILQVTNIQALTSAQCDSLNVGDQIIKKTGTMQHLYNVTYKDETGGGMCLSYIDAENAETVAYDRVEGTWTYTDTTITPLAGG